MLDDIIFSSSIFAKVRPNDYKNWVARMKAINEKRLQKDEKNFIEVDYDLWLKMGDQNKTIHRKGKFGKMAGNAQRCEELKRKRSEIEKRFAQQEMEQDKVWLPNDNT